jgi:hypothetical protein
MDFREIRWDVVNWMHLAQDTDQFWAVVNMVMNLRVPQKVENFLTTRVTTGFSRRTLLHAVSYAALHFSSRNPPVVTEI